MKPKLTFTEAHVEAIFCIVLTCFLVFILWTSV